MRDRQTDRETDKERARDVPNSHSETRGTSGRRGNPMLAVMAAQQALIQRQHQNLLPLLHPGVELRASFKSISYRCHLFEEAFVWKLTKETIHLPLGCIQSAFLALCDSPQLCFSIAAPEFALLCAPACLSLPLCLRACPSLSLSLCAPVPLLALPQTGRPIILELTLLDSRNRCVIFGEKS